MRLKYALVISIVMIVSVLSSAGFAEDKAVSDPWQQLVNIDLKDVAVRSAIDSLFRGSGLNYAIEPDVEGIIPSLTLKDVTFQAALKVIAKTAGLVYRIDSGVVLISLDPKGLGKRVSVDFKKVPLRDALKILSEKAGMTTWPVDLDVPNVEITCSATNETLNRALTDILKLAGARIEGNTIKTGDPWQRPINLEVKNISLSEVLQTMFEGTGINYTLDPSTDRLRVTAVLKNTPLEVALKSVINAAGAMYRIDNDVVVISEKPLYMGPQTQGQGSGSGTENELVNSVRIEFDATLSETCTFKEVKMNPVISAADGQQGQVSLSSNSTSNDGRYHRLATSNLIITPQILSNGRVMLTGNVSQAWYENEWDASEKKDISKMIFNYSHGITASLEPGKRREIAQVSVKNDSGNTDITFTLFAMVTIEPDKVLRPLNQPGYNRYGGGYNMGYTGPRQDPSLQKTDQETDNKPDAPTQVTPRATPQESEPVSN